MLCSEGEAARAVHTVREGSLHTSQEGTDFSLTIEAPGCLGESSLGPHDDTRVRGATVRAGEAGATVLVWRVASIETLIGFDLQAHTPTPTLTLTLTLMGFDLQA